MNSIFKEVDDNLVKAFIAKHMVECATEDYFKFTIFVSNADKLKVITNWCEELRKEYMPSYVNRVKNSVNGYSIEYYNGGILNALVLSENKRGHKCHAILVDENISDDLKELAYYTLLPFPMSFDSIGEYKKSRVMETAIRVD